MTQAALTPSRPVLTDVLPGARVRDLLTIVGAVLLTALAAQIVVPLSFSPVPITGQTFAVLLTAAALGPARGVTAQGLYVALGAAGLPFFADGSSGIEVVFGATGGYLLGFLAAAGVVGLLARRGLDRRPDGTVLAYVLGSLVIYAVGAPWLAVVGDMSLPTAIDLGVIPFLIGDAIKALLAGIALPVAWRLVDTR